MELYMIQVALIPTKETHYDNESPSSHPISLQIDIQPDNRGPLFTKLYEESYFPETVFWHYQAPKSTEHLPKSTTLFIFFDASYERL